MGLEIGASVGLRFIRFFRVQGSIGFTAAKGLYRISSLGLCRV